MYNVQLNIKKGKDQIWHTKYNIYINYLTIGINSDAKILTHLFFVRTYRQFKL